MSQPDANFDLSNASSAASAVTVGRQAQVARRLFPALPPAASAAAAGAVAPASTASQRARSASPQTSLESRMRAVTLRASPFASPAAGIASARRRASSMDSAVSSPAGILMLRRVNPDGTTSTPNFAAHSTTPATSATPFYTPSSGLPL